MNRYFTTIINNTHSSFDLVVDVIRDNSGNDILHPLLL